MQATEHVHTHAVEHHHHAPVQEWLKPALLIGLGLYFASIIATGSLTNYINMRFAWLAYVAAVFFLLLGVAGAHRLIRAGADHHHEHGTPEHHPRGTISWAALAVVAIPLLLGTLIPSRPLGAAAVEGDVSANTLGGDSSAAIALPPEQRTVLDWIRAFRASDDPASFSGQPVDIIGFVYRSDDYPDGMFLVARFVISHCVADATAIGLLVAWSEDLPPDTWVRVRGQLAAGAFQGETHPLIQPASVDVVRQPEHPYLYP